MDAAILRDIEDAEVARASQEIERAPSGDNRRFHSHRYRVEQPRERYRANKWSDDKHLMFGLAEQIHHAGTLECHSIVSTK